MEIRDIEYGREFKYKGWTLTKRYFREMSLKLDCPKGHEWSAYVEFILAEENPKCPGCSRSMVPKKLLWIAATLQWEG